MYSTSEAGFMDDVLKSSYRVPVVVLFHSPACGPCASMKPMIERLAADLAFLLVGVDASVSRGLVMSETVRAVPTVLVYRNGKQCGAPLTGAKSESALRDFLFQRGVTQGQLEV